MRLEAGGVGYSQFLVAPPSHLDELPLVWDLRLILGSSQSVCGVALCCYTWRMQTTISQRELRNDSGVIMRRVEQGESFTITRNGTPVADLVPHEAGSVGRRPRFVPVEAIATGAAALPDWGIGEFSDELHDLDLAVDDRDVDRWSLR